MHNSKTQKITQGAMLLSIMGTVMLLDRQLGSLMADMISVLIPCAIIFYARAWTAKDGIYLAIASIVITLFLGNTTSYIYATVGILVGIGVSINLNRSPKTILILTIILFIIGELCVCFVIYPLIGIPVTQQLTGSLAIATKYHIPTFIMYFSFLFTIALIGTIEGFITFIVSAKLFRRLR